MSERAPSDSSGRSSVRADPLLPAALAAFVAVARLGGFSKAARELGVSQSALTVSVKKLETELRTTLLVRTARGVVPTASGEALVRHAETIERTLRDARHEVSGLESEPRGRFVLGAHESLASYVLPGFMGRFVAKHPSIELALANSNSRDVMRGIVERRIDIGLVVNPESHPDCVIVPLFGDRVEILGLTTKIARRPAADVIAEETLIYVPALAQVQWILHALARERLQPARTLSCSSMELVKSLVLDGAGLGILPRRVAAHRVPRARLRAVGGDALAFTDQIALVRRADMHMTSAARLLLDALRQRGQQLAAS